MGYKCLHASRNSTYMVGEAARFPTPVDAVPKESYLHAFSMLFFGALGEHPSYALIVHFFSLSCPPVKRKNSIPNTLSKDFLKNDGYDLVVLDTDTLWGI